MYDKGRMSFDFVFYWGAIQTRKNIKKVVEEKPDADVYGIPHVIVVIVMTNK
jgi:hypothetical protein